jgi:hypothetical protein
MVAAAAEAGVRLSVVLAASLRRAGALIKQEPSAARACG